MRLDGTGYADFDDKMHGDEWTTFKELLERCELG
jgi:hypothetical protein